MRLFFRIPIPSLVLILSFVACPASALREGMATHFLGVGFPYGACGVPDEVAAFEASVDTLTGQGNPFDYVALNVYNTPGVYTSPGPRPLVGADTAKLGTYDNGRNCGRWLKLVLGDTCDGINDGAAGQAFCRGGAGWFPNAYTGGTITAVVFDQCTDGNAWCRDSKDHLDLHTPILGRLRKDGALLPPMAVPVLNPDGSPKADPNNPWAREFVVKGFENPKVSWDFVPAPNYQGEPRFWFSLDAKIWYMRLIVTHLPNGIHGVEQLVGGTWKKAVMEGDAGQLWILPDPSVTTFTLRLIDADDQLAMGGRTWTMDYPAACGKSCSKPATAADHVVGEGGGVAVARRTASHALDVRFDSRGVLHLGTSADGFVALVRPDGRRTARIPVSNGTATPGPLAPGLWIARWELADGRGASFLNLP